MALNLKTTLNLFNHTTNYISNGSKLNNTFAAIKPQEIKNVELNTLKYCPLAKNDSFIRTKIFPKSVNMVDDFFKSNCIHPDNAETLTLNLYRNIVKSGKKYVRTNEIEHLRAITGLNEEALAKEFDNFASCLSLLKPAGIKYETPYVLTMKLGKTEAKISQIGKGCSGSIYKIDIPGAKPYILKKYHGTEHRISSLEGAYAETAIQKKMTDEKVDDIASLAIANPDNGWVVTEFIDNSYLMRNNGMKLDDFIKKYALKLDDINGGMFVKDKNGKNILVDFGFIVPKKNNPTLQVNRVIEKVNDEIQKEKCILNIDKLVELYKNEPKLRFKIIQEMQQTAETAKCTEFYNRVKLTPQMQLYTKYPEFILSRSVNDPKILETRINEKELQKLMSECGFNTNINDFIGNQSDCNLYASSFNDFISVLFEKMFS